MMGMFGKDKNTVSDKDMAELSRRARKADKDPWLGQKATDKRKASADQRDKRKWS